VTAEPLDLGHDHTLRFTSWAPDRALNPQYDGIPDVDRWGAIVSHPNGPNPVAATSTGRCEGAITFDGPVQQQVEPNRPKWTVESWDPLTLSPRLLCGCGDHGFIRNGRWVPA
jgi:hypothetical protein